MFVVSLGHPRTRAWGHVCRATPRPRSLKPCWSSATRPQPRHAHARPLLVTRTPPNASRGHTGAELAVVGFGGSAEALTSATSHDARRRSPFPAGHTTNSGVVEFQPQQAGRRGWPVSCAVRPGASRARKRGLLSLHGVASWGASGAEAAAPGRSTVHGRADIAPYKQSSKIHLLIFS